MVGDGTLLHTLSWLGSGFPYCHDAFFNEQVHELSGNRPLVERQGIGVARQILIHSISSRLIWSLVRSWILVVLCDSWKATACGVIAGLRGASRGQILCRGA